MEKWIGKVAVVTGAGSGMGAAITIALLHEGVHVVGLDVQKNSSEELARKTFKGKMYELECDVSDLRSVDIAFNWIEETFGAVDILVNCAGVLKRAQFFDLTHSTETFVKTVNVNVNGYILTTRRAFKTMQNQPFGYIINISSMAGQWRGRDEDVNFGLNVYGATKHAVTQLSALMKAESSLAHTRIRVTVSGVSVDAT